MSGFNDLYRNPDHLLADAVGLSMCEFDGTNTNFELYAKFVPGDAEGERLLAEMMKRRGGADFYGTPMTFETPTHMVMVTTFGIFEETRENQLRKVELFPNDREFAIGDSFSKRARQILASPDSFKELGVLVEDQFGKPDPDFLAHLSSAYFLSMKKSLIYVFDAQTSDQTLDWWWQFWGVNTNCGNNACPKP
jgi:hypothetical protein